MFKRKGITPVIAIVLLLLITVGAVTVVYQQFNDLTQNNQQQEELQQNQRLQSASYSIVGVKSSNPNQPQNGNMVVTIKNTGDVTMNLSKEGTLMVGKDGQTPQATSVLGGNSCNQFGTPQPGETEDCDTQVIWPTPDDGQSTTIQLQIGEVTKATYTCSATSGSRYC